MIIQKLRSASSDWTVLHKDLSAATKILKLNSTTAEDTASDFGNTAPTSSVFSTGITGGGGWRLATYLRPLALKSNRPCRRRETQMGQRETLLDPGPEIRDF